MALTPQQQTILNDAQKQLTNISGQVQTFKQAQDLGMKIRSNTQVNDARNFITSKGVSINEPIDASRLGSTSAIKINPVTPITGVDNGLGQMTTQATAFSDEYSKNLADQAKLSEQSKTKSKSKLMQALTGSKGEAELTDEAYADVDPVKKELNDINQKILQEQTGLQRQLEEIEKNPRGMTTFGLNDELDRAKTASYRRQADLSIVQLGIQGKYDSALEQANRKVDIMLEKQQKYLDALTLDYQDNKDAFTKAEQRQFETMQADRENELATKREELKDVNAYALNAQQNGAPASVVQAMLGADTRQEALGIGGAYIDRLDRLTKQAQLSKIQQELQTTGNTPQQADRKIEVVTLANELKKNTTPGKKSAVGASLAKFVPFGQALGLQGNRTAFEARVNTLKSNLTLDNLKLLKGAMSDKDLLFLNSIGSSLDVNMSEDQFNKELGRVINKLDPTGEIVGALNGDSETKVLNGNTYIKVKGGWQLQK